MTPFDRAHDAYFLALELDSAVAHFSDAVVCILLGIFAEAHRELWRGGFTKVRPRDGARYSTPVPATKTMAKRRAPVARKGGRRR